MNFLFELLLEKNSIKSSAIASFDHLTVKLRMQKLDLETEKNLAFFLQKSTIFLQFCISHDQLS